jgi:NAD-dependent DNA ligase
VENKFTQSELEWIIKYHAHLYYCLNKNEITDYEYDKYYDLLKKEYPDSILLERIGCGMCKELHK